MAPEMLPGFARPVVHCDMDDRLMFWSVERPSAGPLTTVWSARCIGYHRSLGMTAQALAAFRIVYRLIAGAPGARADVALVRLRPLSAADHLC